MNMHNPARFMDSTLDRQRPEANQAHGCAGIVGWLNRKIAGLRAHEDQD